MRAVFGSAEGKSKLKLYEPVPRISCLSNRGWCAMSKSIEPSIYKWCQFATRCRPSLCASDRRTTPEEESQA